MAKTAWSSSFLSGDGHSCPSNILIATLGLAFALTATAQHIPRPLIVNPDHHGFPTQPSFDVQSDGSVRFVWNTYANHRERLYTTSFRDGKRSRTQILSPEDGVYWMPQYVADGVNSGWAVWQTRRDGVWRIEGRRLEDGFWEPTELLSTRGSDALTPDAVVTSAGLLTAWEDVSVQPQRIAVRREDGRVEHVSPEEKPCYRPALADRGGKLWVLWDCYEGLDYAVYARKLDGGAPTKLSGDSNAMDAVVLALGDGRLVAAWVAEDGVLGKGAIDQRHRIEVATLEGGRWSEPRVAADLAHSLLSRVEPTVTAIWGFAGHRLSPMLIEQSGRPWLLWERKLTSEGRSTDPGALLGMPLDRADAQPVRIDSGLVQYDAATPGAELLVAGFDPTHNLVVQRAELGDAQPVEPFDVTGWQPIDLPLPHWGYEVGSRPSIEIDGKKHFLYWGDLHVHTTLTADAEGEVDELMHYARDKAKIDVVVMQENDASSWLDANDQGAYRNQVLTDSEYALSVYFSRKYTEPGRFVALPGWEWSDRTDDGNANHRTVIFAGDTAPMIRHPEEDDFEALCDMVEAAGGVMNSQHPTFRLVRRPCEGNIEVAAGWGVYINDPAKIHSDLSAGFKVGFAATSDGHRRNPGVGGGLTGFWAPELTPAAMLQALKEHRIYATNGSRLVLDARANGAFMGTDMEAAGPVELTLHARSPQAKIVKAVLVRDGDEIFSAPGDGLQLDLRYEDQPGQGFHWYYWRVELEGESPDYPGNIKVAEGHLGWTSPHRVTVR
ncbi:MAG: DUF3604 domain-containing protein [Acidobacteria bacterium]|nr:DUF3604 domain-containing protein [Acidobacteriota bacterium]